MFYFRLLEVKHNNIFPKIVLLGLCDAMLILGLSLRNSKMRKGLLSYSSAFVNCVCFCLSISASFKSY